MRSVRGMTLLEVVVGVAIAAFLAAMLAAATAESRRQAGLTQNLANLQRFAAGTTTYFADHGDRFWGFSWRAGHVGPFGAADTEMQAMADQAADIMNRRGGAMLNRVMDWYPGPYYSHLTLLDHLDASITPEFVVAPEDDKRRRWQSNPSNIANLPLTDRPDSPAASLQRWGFSSSYELGPAFYEADARWYPSSTSFADTVDQHGQAHNRWHVPSRRIGGRFAHEVSFPSQKVMVFERYQRHFGPRELYFMFPDARVPLLFADGAAAVRHTYKANRGFRPNSPRTPAPTLVNYEPELWEPPTPSGRPGLTVIGSYRWTRGGLKGSDYDGQDIDTSDW